MIGLKEEVEVVIFLFGVCGGFVVSLFVGGKMGLVVSLESLGFGRFV